MNVWFSEGDSKGWAIDEDLRLLKGALEGGFHESTLGNADVVVAVWWWKLLRIPPGRLAGKFVIALADNPPFRYIRHPSFIQGVELVDMWVGRSSEAVRQFGELRLPVLFAPYAVDLSIFRPLDDRKLLREQFVGENGIPANRVLIGNFHRDTDGGPDGGPKVQKAPEVFLEVLQGLQQRGVPVHAVLAGPRRHWLKRALASAGILFTFVGDSNIAGDDYPANIIPRTALNDLYNVLDLYIITSRWEGGPHSVLEACASGCPAISTPVGVAADLLPPGRIFNSISEGIDCAESALSERPVTNSDVEKSRGAVAAGHSAEALGTHFRAILEEGGRRRGSGRTIRWRKRTDLPGVIGSLHRFLSRSGPALKLSLPLPVASGDRNGDMLLQWVRQNAKQLRLSIVADSAAHVRVERRSHGLCLTGVATGRSIELHFDLEEFLANSSKDYLASGAMLTAPSDFCDGSRETDDCAQIVVRSLAGPEKLSESGNAFVKAAVMLREEGC